MEWTNKNAIIAHWGNLYQWSIPIINVWNVYSLYEIILVKALRNQNSIGFNSPPLTVQGKIIVYRQNTFRWLFRYTILVSNYVML